MENVWFFFSSKNEKCSSVWLMGSNNQNLKEIQVLGASPIEKNTTASCNKAYFLSLVSVYNKYSEFKIWKH